MSESALDIMWGLRLEDGQLWGAVARDFQKEDAYAIFGDEPPNLHFLLRPRGGSKTTDIAAVAISWLLADAPPFANGAVIANTAKQASILMDAIQSFYAMTPQLEGSLDVQNLKVIAPNGAWIEVLSQSAPGAWGLRNAHLLICDEFCQWDETISAKRVWSAIISTIPKVKGCRLILLSTAGEPSHWSYRDVYEPSLTDPSWHVHQVPGPVPWMDEAEIAAVQRQLTVGAYERLVLNQWSQEDDSAISESDFADAAISCVESFSTQGEHYGKRAHGVRTTTYRPDRTYILTVDIGISNDATVMVIAHREQIEGAPKGTFRVVVDHLERWQGTKVNRVQLDHVLEWIQESCLAWGNPTVWAAPYQFQGTLQTLNRRGVRAKEWIFGPTSVGQVATALVQAFHNRQIWVPDDVGLREELLKLRLRDNSVGVTRLDHARSGHDDQAVAIGIACHVLLAQSHRRAAEWIQTQKDRIAAATPSPADAEDRAQKAARRAVERHLARTHGRDTLVQRGVRRRQASCQHRLGPTHCVFCGTETPVSTAS